MNDRGLKDGIRRKVENLPEDTAFTSSDFTYIADSQNVRTDNGTIARATRGVYYKPRFSGLLGQVVPPDVDEVAHAIARARGWEIAPSGDHALNMLGLDTQVPAVYAYISTGPYVSIQVGPYKVRFKHAANRNVVGMSPLTALVVQALKTLGKDRANDTRLAAHRLWHRRALGGALQHQAGRIQARDCRAHKPLSR